MTIILNYIDNVWMNVDSDNEGLLYDMREKFSFYVPGYRFMPKYKAKIWDGTIKLFNPYQKRIYIGLLDEVKKFCQDRQIDLVIDPAILGKSEITKESFKEFVDELDIHSGGNKITPYLHQYVGAFYGLQNKRSTLLSPTASGKSLIIYMIIRYLQTINNKKTLIVVPTTSLVEQMYSDFDDYASAIDWNSEDNVHRIYQGADKKTNKPIVVSTWQSVYKMGKKYFEQFDAIIVDEAHQLKANSLTGILEKSTAKYRIGLTGTLDDAQAHEWVIQGLLGPKKVLATTKDLMDKNLIANLHINILNLKYNEIDKKIVRTQHKDYQAEVDYIINHGKRNELICNMANKFESNTLILFLKKEHGRELKRLLDIKVKETGKQVHLVYGDTKTDVREKVRKLTEENSNVIIIASYGVFSTGISIKNLHHLILASPTKSKIRVLQSIGRSLRKHKSKVRAELYDLVDDFSHKSYKNYAVKHFIERFNYYTKEKFEYKNIKINI